MAKKFRLRPGNAFLKMTQCSTLPLATDLLYMTSVFFPPWRFHFLPAFCSLDETCFSLFFPPRFPRDSTAFSPPFSIVSAPNSACLFGWLDAAVFTLLSLPLQLCVGGAFPSLGNTFSFSVGFLLTPPDSEALCVSRFSARLSCFSLSEELSLLPVEKVPCPLLTTSSSPFPLALGLAFFSFQMQYTFFLPTHSRIWAPFRV